MRYSPALVLATSTRLVAILVAVAICGPSVPARAQPEPGDARQDTIAALHREGEVMFAAADYAGARDAWFDAYERIEPTEQTWPYRATLLSLVVTAALAEYERDAREDRMQEIVSLVDLARSTPALDPEVASMLATEWGRVEPYAAQDVDVEPEPTPTPPPVLVPPSPAPQPDADAPAPAPTPTQPTRRTGSHIAWIGAGTAVLLGGVATTVVGTRFEPRAAALVRGTNDSTTMAPGADFIAAEARKGRGWIVGGSVAATLGAAALVTGIVLLVRSRH